MQYVWLVTQQGWWWFLLSGIGTGLGILYPFFWWLVFPGIAAFFVGVARSVSWRAVGWGGWLAGTIKIGCALGWIFTTYPIEWIELGLGRYELPVIGLYWLTLSLVVGSAMGLLAGTLYVLRSRTQRTWWIVGAILLWLLAESLGAFFFSLFTYGAGGTLNALFSFGMVGNLLSEHHGLLQFARLGGVYALSGVAVAGGITIFLYRRWLVSRRGLLGSGVGVAILIATAPLPVSVSSVMLPGTVAIIDTTFGGSHFFAIEDQARVKADALQMAVMEAKSMGAEYIVLPEGSHTMPSVLTTGEAFSRFTDTYDITDSVVIESVRVPISQRESALRGRIFDEQTERAYTIDKQRLVPQGEFMPVFYVMLLSQLGLKEAVTTIENTLDYRPGPYASQATFPSHVPSVLFCFAEADPLSVRRMTKERVVPFIVNPISHAWFHEPESLWWQYDAMRKIHAVWNQVPIVTAGNMSKGAWYSTTGQKILPREVASGEWWTVSVVP